MVCNRCILVIRQELEKLNLVPGNITLGEVELIKEPDKKALAQLKANLAAVGFEVLDDSKKQLIEKIRSIIIEQIHRQPVDDEHNFSEILSKNLHKDYSHLSGLFSDVEGITIEKYIINQKIERAKELITYNEMNFNEIACQLGYSSSAHLSAQFKKVTGLTPTHFKKAGNMRRKPIDKI